MIKKILLFALLLQPLYVAAASGADSRYSIHTSGLNSSVYVNMLYFANLVNQYATDFTLVTLPSTPDAPEEFHLGAFEIPASPAIDEH